MLAPSGSSEQCNHAILLVSSRLPCEMAFRQTSPLKFSLPCRLGPASNLLLLASIGLPGDLYGRSAIWARPVSSTFLVRARGSAFGRPFRFSRVMERPGFLVGMPSAELLMGCFSLDFPGLAGLLPARPRPRESAKRWRGWRSKSMQP